MRILARPKRRNIKSDPGNAYLYKTIEEKGHAVIEWDSFKKIFSRYDIVHIHWPDNLLADPNVLRVLVKFTAFVVMSFCQKFVVGKPIIWTAHNMVSHERYHRFVERVFWMYMEYVLDGVIFHDSSLVFSSLRQISLGGKLVGVAPLPWFKGMYPNEMSVSGSRDRLGYSDQNRVIVFLGQIRKYKNVDGLIDSFSKTCNENFRLCIAGRSDDKEYLDQLTESSLDDDRISLFFGYIPDEDIQIYIKSADLVVLPFVEVTNSGSALLALSFGGRLLVPRTSYFESLQREFGSERVLLFEGALEPEDVESALARRWRSSIAGSSVRDLSSVADLHVKFYEKIVFRWNSDYI